MAKLVTEIKLTEIDEVKALFELLTDNMDCVSEPLKSRLKDWFGGNNKGWVSWSDISPEFVGNMSCVVLVDGVEHLFVTGFNKILRKVKILDTKNNRVEIVNAKSFSINNIGQANFVEWS